MTKRILFWPELPVERTVIRKLLILDGYEMTQDNKDVVAAFLWKDSTIVDALPDNFISNADIRWFNRHCLNISKSFVHAAYKACTGIDLNVDPLVFQGKYVEKSNRNASHDGHILCAPISKSRDGMVYMKLVDNTTDHWRGERMVEDIRVVVIGENIPMVYRKYRPVSERFSNKNSFVELSSIAKEFTKSEQRMIYAFCKMISLDYGELDVIRDRVSRIAYIIDANKTPFGPPNGISESDEKLALTAISRVFHQVISIGGASCVV